MKRVVIESPYAGEVETNLAYLRAAMHDCLVHRKETPYASHGLYTQPGVLDDTIPEERALGIEAGFEWRQAAELSVFYVDRGMTTGMNYGLKDAITKGRAFEYRAFLDGYGAGEQSYTLNFETIGGSVRADAPRLPGGCVVRGNILECIEALCDIAKERKP
jgi:hypothetical protein